LACIADLAIWRALFEHPQNPSGLVALPYYNKSISEAICESSLEWVLDSGAFTAHASGEEIKLQDFIDVCKKALDSKNPPAEIFALDTIGDPASSYQNAVEMKRQGLDVIPAFHIGSPQDDLERICDGWPKIALGGVAGATAKGVRSDWFEACFARVWPKKVHGFGVAGRTDVLKFPWHTTDASSWQSGPTRFNRWHQYGNTQVHGELLTGKRDWAVHLKGEVDYFMKLEQQAQFKWRNQMAQLTEEC